jgi:hypothetical protein
VKVSDLLRYGLWLGVAETAFENRRHYRMATTWLPHLLTNTLSLFLPDVLRFIFSKRQRSISAISTPLTEVITQTAQASVSANDHYAGYVAPLAVGYILSHPRFNIYQGEWAEKRFAGLGLDALPHGATAFGLVSLAAETAENAAVIVPKNNALYPLVRWAAQHPTLFTGFILIAATVFWEYGEYRIQQYELEQQGGDMSKINMQWSLADTLRDVAANTLGWLAATLLRHFSAK